jgi:serine protease Do
MRFVNKHVAYFQPATIRKVENSQGGEGTKLGVSVDRLTPGIAHQLGLPAETTGIVITDIEPGSPAEDVGLQQDGVIQAVNRARVFTPDQFVRLVRELPANQLAVLLIDHAGDHLYVTVRP